MAKVIRLLNTVRGYLKWIVIGGAVLMLGYWGSSFIPSSTSPVKTSGGADSMYVAPTPLSFLEDGAVLTNDEEGNSTSRGDTPDGKDPQGTVRIDPPEHNEESQEVGPTKRFVELAVERNQNTFFPDLTGPDVPIRTLNQSSQTITYTPPNKGFIEWDLRPSLGAGVVSLHPSVVAGASPLRVGPVRVGAYVSVPTRRDGNVSVMLDLSTRVFHHLEAGIGVTHRQNLAFSVRYRF